MNRFTFIRHIGLIAAQEFGSRLRTGWVVISAAVWLCAIGLTSFYGLVQVGRVGMQGYERTTVSLLNVVQYLVPLLGLLLGHDLLVTEREERTLAFILASGVSRVHVLLGKLLGGALCLLFPLVLGFALAGTAIGLTVGSGGVGGFIRMAIGGVALGLIFLAIGLMLSAWSRSHMQALVLALLTWCFAVFAFDLLALGLVISVKAPAAVQQIEAACDPTHLNSGVDLHSAYDLSSDTPSVSASASHADMLDWIYLNPIDLFRAMTWSAPADRPLSIALATGACLLWLGGCLGASAWKLKRLDL